MFEIILAICAVIAGAIASISGFGIGSILTPLLAFKVGTKMAVAAVSIPHLIATAIRFWMLKSHIDIKVLINFGIMSAVGGILGAILNAKFGGPILTLVLGCLLIFSGFTGITGLAQKIRFTGISAWIAGFLSGVFGGLVGNQGGIRAGALFGFDISKEAFVATSTAIGIVIDAARIPIYFINDFHFSLDILPIILILTIGVIIGTLLGVKLLRKIPKENFIRIVSGIIFLLGTYMFSDGIRKL